MTSSTISPMNPIRARTPGARCCIQSLASGAHTFFDSARTRVTLLNPQWTHTTASGGSSSFAQNGHRATSSPSSTTPSALGLAPSSSSSWNLYGAGAGLGSSFGSPFLAFPAPPPGFDGPPGLVGPAAFGALGSLTTNGWPQSLHLIFLP